MDVRRSVVEALRRRPAVADALLGVALGALFLVGPLVAPDGLRDEGALDLTPTPPGVALTVLAAVALTQWRRHPAVTVAVTTAVTAVSMLNAWDVYVATPAVVIAVYGYAVRAPRARAVAAAVAVSLTIGLAGLWRDEWGEHDKVILLLWTATAVAAAVQNRRATMAALEDRARRAEESREETARRRVAEDRVRIARELHDVIAHHVAVMSVQSGVAEHMVERDPAAAREALAHVRTASRAVLAELQSVLGVLRQDEAALPTAPAPRLSGLDVLVTSFRATGARVESTLPATPPALSPAADVAAFRLVQEALTNVQKHAHGAAAAVRVESQGTLALIEVTNGRPPRLPAGPNRAEPSGTASDAASVEPRDAATGSGLGLVGMRERVLAAGGSLETGPTADGGFRVAAHLPLAQEDR
ncbi:sensor histidine kinase [Actinotalea subterranea]|uniref:sensor histidine kinase n=1 Tax=Actinotalea subterranea TaxID=2607497 RepID=UPI0011ED3585|nr:histidine kinase [Actinotalea subterranea]